ncbi:MAG: DMT family transporter [Burkholderiaceae bacterium]|nr:DMT family transporter [Roseateles sp.]MBV8470043.1 DMT family transporter [Burkholderiaceae bacterium]
MGRREGNQGINNIMDLFKGVAYALVTGLMWGWVFVVPVMLPGYAPATLAFGRYCAFGLVAVALGLVDGERLLALRAADWREAFKLALVGNIIYYLCLAASIQISGVPLASVLIGTLPVVIALCANWQERSVPWAALLPSLALMATGIACVNQSELALIAPDQGVHYLAGALLALCAVAAWTWYPIRNASWLKRHPELSTTTWTTAQGLATLPLAALGWILFGAWQGQDLWSLGPQPWRFLALMLSMGLFASWLGTLAWSRAGRLLPSALAGQLIVFETLAALAYGYFYRGRWPDALSLVGIALLVAGVVLGVRRFQRHTAAPIH